MIKSYPRDNIFQHEHSILPDPNCSDEYKLKLRYLFEVSSSKTSRIDFLSDYIYFPDESKDYSEI
jgi:hypothetical protein